MSKIAKKENLSSAKDRKLQKDSQRSNLIKNIDSLRTKIKKDNELLPRSRTSNRNRGIMAGIIILVFMGVIIANYFGLFQFLGFIPNPGPPPCQSVGGFTCVSSVNPLTDNGKIVFVYVGAEYCPYCAVERWAIVTALSQLGTFSNLANITNAPASVEPTLHDIPTYTFVGASYSSSYIEFDSVETADSYGHSLQTPTTLQNRLINTYDSGGSIPFISIGEKYFKVGSNPILDPASFVGVSFSYVKNQVDTKSGSLYSAINTESTNIINVINTLLNQITTTTTTASSHAQLSSKSFNNQIIMHTSEKCFAININKEYIRNYMNSSALKTIFSQY